jgi:parvulin-like peptidyl-prolyl isomerase
VGQAESQGNARVRTPARLACAAVHELVQAKLEQRAPEIAPASDGKAPKVINIMAALKESVQAKGRAKVQDGVRKRMAKETVKSVATKLRSARASQRRSAH